MSLTGLDAPSARPPGTPRWIRLRSSASPGVLVPSAYRPWGSNLPRGFHAAVRWPSWVSHPFRALRPPKPSRVCFTPQRPWDLPLQRLSSTRVYFPLPGKFPSCRYFLPRFFSEGERSQQGRPTSGVFSPRGAVRPSPPKRIKAPTRSWGSAPLAFSPPRPVAEAKPSCASPDGPHEFDRLAALQGVAGCGIG